MTNIRTSLTSFIILLYLIGMDSSLFAAKEPVSNNSTEVKAGEPKEVQKDPKSKDAKDSKLAAKEPDKKPAGDGGPPPPAKELSSEDEATAERKEEQVAVARAVSSDPVQIYGWREWVTISDGKAKLKLKAKLDTGALTSSIHAEDKKLFERDGKKWVRFVIRDTRSKDGVRIRMEAPLVRIARIKEPGGESTTREVVRLPFKLGDRTFKADFTLNDRGNMLSPVLIGRRAICQLGWVDPTRAYLAGKKVLR